MLFCVQGGLTDVWKENILEDSETKELEYVIVREFLVDLKKEFGREDVKTIKVVELNKVE